MRNLVFNTVLFLLIFSGGIAQEGDYGESNDGSEKRCFEEISNPSYTYRIESKTVDVLFPIRGPLAALKNGTIVVTDALERKSFSCYSPNGVRWIRPDLQSLIKKIVPFGDGFIATDSNSRIYFYDSHCNLTRKLERDNGYGTQERVRRLEQAGALSDGTVAMGINYRRDKYGGDINIFDSNGVLKERYNVGADYFHTPPRELPNGNIAIGGSDGDKNYIYIVNRKDRSVERSPPMLKGRIEDFIKLSDGKTLAISFNGEKRDNQAVYFYNYQDGKWHQSLLCPGQGLMNLFTTVRQNLLRWQMETS